MINWLLEHKFESHLVAFTLMLFASIGLYFSVDVYRSGSIYGFIGLFASANLLAMVVK